MRILLLSVVVLLVISAVLGAPGAKTQPCAMECPDLNPVCAGVKGTSIDDRSTKSFGSECVVRKYNCEKGTDLEVLSQGECPGGKGIRLQ